MGKKEIPAGVTVTYQLQYRRCGKASSCKTCRTSQGHGPYWYGYWRETGEMLKRGQRHKQGKLHSIYFGKVHPDLLELTDAIEGKEGRVV